MFSVYKRFISDHYQDACVICLEPVQSARGVVVEPGMHAMSHGPMRQSICQLMCIAKKNLSLNNGDLHPIHYSCLEAVENASDRCPTCRAPSEAFVTWKEKSIVELKNIAKDMHLGSCVGIYIGVVVNGLYAANDPRPLVSLASAIGSVLTFSAISGVAMLHGLLPSLQEYTKGSIEFIAWSTILTIPLLTVLIKDTEIGCIKMPMLAVYTPILSMTAGTVGGPVGGFLYRRVKHLLPENSNEFFDLR